MVLKGVPLQLSAEQVQGMCTPYGALHSFRLLKHFHTGHSLGWAIAVYEVPACAHKAATALSGLHVVDRVLRAQLTHSPMHTASQFTDAAKTNVYIAGTCCSGYDVP